MAEAKHWKCRDLQCDKSFSNKSNRDRHERKAGHAPPNRRDSILNPLFNDESKEYVCPLPGCNLMSKYKSNITRHIKTGCPTLSKKENNRVCPHCNQTFTQKWNRDHHVKRMHPSEPERFSNVGGEEMIATLNQATSDVMNVSILSSDVSTVIEQSMEVVDMDTSIFEVYDAEPQGSEVPAVVEQFILTQIKTAMLLPVKWMLVKQK